MNIKRLFTISGSLLLGLTIILIWLLFGPPILTRAASYTVCPAGPPTCDYSSIQSAVDAAGNGDVIKVAAGTYTGINNQGGLAQVVYIDKSVTIRGGYTTTNWTTSDPVANPTTLDAQGGGRVLSIIGNISPTIEGLHITGGEADGLGGSKFGGDAGGGVLIQTATAVIRDNQIFSNAVSSHNGDGGGVYLYQSDATIDGNTISDNFARKGGGGLRLENSAATLSGNTITLNISGEHGGGLFLSYSPATLNGNTISYNTAAVAGQGGGGGGIMLDLSAARLNNNTIISNASGGGGGLMIIESDYAALYGNIVSYNESESESGGGLDCRGSDEVIINGNTFSYNSADSGGGIIIHEDCTLLMMGNIISHNTAINFGGGGVLGGNGILTNNIIVDNNAGNNGSALYISSGSPLMLHNTIARNSGGDGSGIHFDGSTITLTNNIIADHVVGILVDSGATASLETTLWGSGSWANGTDWAGTGTINTTNDLWGNPDFINPNGGDYHIGPDSDAIDQGVDAGVTNDIDHHPRPYQEPDIGADEYWPPGALKFIYLPMVIR